MDLFNEWTMEKRTQLPAVDLYVLLQRELRRRQPPQCTSCFMQLPFRVDRRDPEQPNWEVVMPPPCEYACAGVIDELVDEFGLLYDLKPEVETHAN